MQGVTDQDVPFKSFTHSIYRYANSDYLHPAFAKILLRSLLTQLGEDALIFFASVWTSITSGSLKTAALRHATAFVKAYTSGTDFQLVLPCLLIAFQDRDKIVRDAAKGLLRAVMGSIQGQPSSFYALDTFYGPRSSEFQFVSRAGAKRPI